MAYRLWSAPPSSEDPATCSMVGPNALWVLRCACEICWPVTELRALTANNTAQYTGVYSLECISQDSMLCGGLQEYRHTRGVTSELRHVLARYRQRRCLACPLIELRQTGSRPASELLSRNYILESHLKLRPRLSIACSSVLARHF